ncbi:NAD(P)-binding protein [Pseudovirgaria hyperparasitica]|uniref:NAD(P)-binding protein n=1 Tax=Pseudovirgaria hyperparasitica TaxID=470096 RepID=A0A6A6WMQ6_9PEZI|nr:NAD(P)-binding protein [Pseudovirgaria hyperparasitica]KAF2763500.1 NAD(P)-binding protein [Pseudovirgaria hyperparasitica]
MSIPSSTKQWLLASNPSGVPSVSETFKEVTTTLPSLADGQALLKTRYLSNDPAQRGWIDKYEDESRLYVPPIHPGEVMRAGALCEVIESKAAHLHPGDIVQAGVGWVQYSVQDAAALKPLPPLPNGLPITHYLGSLGMTGLTAYYGTKEIARASPDDVVVVSGAAGAAGNMVVQIAKHIIGCKTVIGIAGGQAKCDYVKSLGADACVDYKTADWQQELVKLTPDFVNVYFDNVGGDILDFLLSRMARYGRVAACGAIANYNAGDQAAGIKNWFQIVSMRLEIRGFIVFDHMKQFEESRGVLMKALKEGKIRVGEESQTVVKASFDQIPETWLGLFEGKNQGKLVTELV